MILLSLESVGMRIYEVPTYSMVQIYSMDSETLNLTPYTGK